MVEPRIGVKFCGGCNPVINRGRIYKELQRQCPGRCGLIRDEQDEVWDIGVVLGGCPVACADSDELRQKARKWIVVGGNMVDFYPVDESNIVETIIEKAKMLSQTD